MKNITIICMIFSTLLCNSCKKETINNPSGYPSFLNSLNSLWGNDTSDFFVTISSSYGISIYDNNGFSINKASTVIEAASINEINVGMLSINDFDIPFQSLSYARHCDSIFTPSIVLGQTNTYKLSGIDFPSFEINQYAPTVTHLYHSGLVDNKLPRNNNLSISWDPDEQFSQLSSLMILYAENEASGESQTVELEVNDSDGGIIINSTELAKFNDYPYVRVFYARGYNEIHTISEQTIDLRFVNFSYLRVYFSN